MKDHAPSDLVRSLSVAPRDRIFVSDYVRDVEVGAFPSERGVTQRLRFNIVLELTAEALPLNDNVDRVPSYDRIVKAVDRALSQDRHNLLETVAETIAADCLSGPRAERVSVRIEKLDRIPGTLGVEILRERKAMHAPAPPRTTNARVVALDIDTAPVEACAEWIDAVLSSATPCVICPRAAAHTPEGSGLRIGLIDVTKAAWILAARDKRLTVVERWAEVEWALGAGKTAILAPDRMVMDTVSVPDWISAEPIALAAWVAGRLEVDKVLVAGARHTTPMFNGIEIVPVPTARDLPRD